MAVIKTNYGFQIRCSGLHMSLAFAPCGCRLGKLLIGRKGRGFNSQCKKHAGTKGVTMGKNYQLPFLTVGKIRLMFVFIPRVFGLGFMHANGGGSVENTFNVGPFAFVIQRAKPIDENDIKAMLDSLLKDKKPGEHTIPSPPLGLDDRRLEEKIKSLPLKAN